MAVGCNFHHTHQISNAPLKPFENSRILHRFGMNCLAASRSVRMDSVAPIPLRDR